MLKSEAHTGNKDVPALFFFLEQLEDMRSQFVNVELRSVDDQVGDGADVLQVPAFRSERRLDRSVVVQRMRAASLAVTWHQDRIRGLEEDHLGSDDPLHRFDNGRQLLQLAAFANVHNQRGARDFGGLSHQFCEAWYQADRQVIDAVVAEVFKRLQNGGFPGTAHSRDDDQLARRPAARGAFAREFPLSVGNFSSYPA